MLNLSLVLGVQNWPGNIELSADGRTLFGKSVTFILATFYFHTKVAIKYVEIAKNDSSVYEAINDGTIDLFYSRYGLRNASYSNHGQAAVGSLGVIGADQCHMFYKSEMSGTQSTNIVQLAANFFTLSERGLVYSLLGLLVICTVYRLIIIFNTISSSHYLTRYLFSFVELIKSSKLYNILSQKVLKVIVVITSFFLVLPISYLIVNLDDVRQPTRIKDLQDSRVEKIFLQADICSNTFEEKFPPESPIRALVLDGGLVPDLIAVIKHKPGSCICFGSNALAHLFRWDFCYIEPGHCSSVDLVQSKNLFDALSTLLYRKTVDQRKNNFLQRYAFSMQENGFWKSVEIKLRASNREIYKVHNLMKNSEWKTVTWKPITFKFISTLQKIYFVSCIFASFIFIVFEYYLPFFIPQLSNRVQPV